MGAPTQLTRQPEKWQLEAQKYDLQRLGLERLNEYIVFGSGVGLTFEKYKNLLLKHTSRPYRGLGLNIIRVSWPNLEPYQDFLLDWQDKIKEPDDEFGAFKPKERAKWNNYDPISVENLLLDWMYEWRDDVSFNTSEAEYQITQIKIMEHGVVDRITKDAFEYDYRGRKILIRPPMDGEINWGNDMIELLGPFMGSEWNRYYLKQNGISLRHYNRKYNDGLTCRKHRWIKKLWGR